MTQIMPMVGVMFSYFFMCGLLLANRSGDGMSVLEQTPRMALRDGLGGVNRSGDGMSV